jgi:hypothetical protein
MELAGRAPFWACLSSSLSFLALPANDSKTLESISLILSNSFWFAVGEHETFERVVDVEIRTAEAVSFEGIRTYGTVDGGLEAMRYAWPKLDQVFSIRRGPKDKALDTEGLKHCYWGPHRAHPQLLDKHPVDMLVVEKSMMSKSPDATQLASPHLGMVKNAKELNRPTLIVESWQGSAQLWTYGPMGKATVTSWDHLGYYSRCKRVEATQVGGAIDQSRLIVVRIRRSSNITEWRWQDLEKSDSQVRRPMSNLLTPSGLLPRNTTYSTNRPKSYPRWNQDPMPPKPGYFIETEKGVRRVLIDEFVRGLGLPKAVAELPSEVTKPLVNHTTSLFHWEYLSTCLTSVVARSVKTTPAPKVDPHSPREATNQQAAAAAATAASEATSEPPTFKWQPPDMSIGSPWYLRQLVTLRKASESFENPTEVYKEGLEILDVVRGNYSETGPDPKKLQVLWWNFPSIHWHELKEGSPMNFLEDPPEGIHENSQMDEQGLKAAAQFVDELLSLGAVATEEEGYRVLATAPLFLVDKPGQPGQYRVIADMLRGGQNACIGNDPVVLTGSSHILDRLYRGGYSAVADMAKMFYQFKTAPRDRPYLGLKHPVTGDLLYYTGLPMGAGNSPALAARYGIAFLRKLREQYDIFKGKGRANCYWTGLSYVGFDPDKGYGFVFEDESGEGVVLLWVWIDDFLIHGPTYEKTSAALTIFLDACVDCGLLCHPTKLTPPQQRVKYCGLEIDTSDIPMLRIPTEKRERSYAMVDYLLSQGSNKEFSRLALAVVAGTLQSLVEATPRRMGSTRLRSLHSDVRPPGMGTGVEPYYTKTTLSEKTRTDLEWWLSFLAQKSTGRAVRSAMSATLIPTFGDGSGTGTGGTIQLPEGPLQMWKGKWHPMVYHHSSNAKELATLLITLETLCENHREEATGTTIFYMTDNSVTYYVAASGTSRSPRLQHLIERIRALELELESHLQVVHIPGLVMIQQGTDGLSRGIWMNPLQDLRNPEEITQAIFEPAVPDWELVLPYISALPQPPLQNWSIQNWAHENWDELEVMDNATIWFPPPEIARQLLTFVLERWVERPLTTTALFFVPRIISDVWRGVSRHLQELPTIYPLETAMNFPPTLPIPIIVLYLPPHQRVLPDNDRRLDRTPIPSHGRWHREQAAFMRGMQGGNIDG